MAAYRQSVVEDHSIEQLRPLHLGLWPRLSRDAQGLPRLDRLASTAGVPVFGALLRSGR